MSQLSIRVAARHLKAEFEGPAPTAAPTNEPESTDEPVEHGEFLNDEELDDLSDLLKPFIARAKEIGMGKDAVVEFVNEIIDELM